MIQLLTERETEFLTKLRVIIVEYNAEIHCTKAGSIECIVDAHLNPDWITPIVFSDCLDESDIDDLFEESRTKTRMIIDKYCSGEEEDVSV